MTAALYVLGVLVFVAALGFSIAWHELGHLLPAKRFGVKVTEYMIGFGPTIRSWKRGETTYGFKAIPLGGYVKMIGMLPPRPGEDARHLRESSTGAVQTMADDPRRANVEEIAPEDEHRTFWRLPVRKRVAIMLGGPLMNLVLATVLFAALLMGFGDPSKPVSTLTVQTVSLCMARAQDPPPDTVPTRPEDCPRGQTPAAAAGMRPGDTITAVDGRRTTGWEQVRTAIREHAGRPMTLTLDRAGTPVEVTVTPVPNQVVKLDADGDVVLGEDDEPEFVQAGFLGVSPRQEFAKQPVTAVPGFVAQQVVASGRVILTLPQRMVDVAQAAFGPDERDPNGPMSVVGVGRITGEVVSFEGIEVADKLATLLGIIASLNIFLFVFNLVPLLPLDGGHVAGALWEWLRRQLAKVFRRPDPGPVDVSKALPLVYVVSGLLIVMSVMLIYADIVKPISLRG